MNETELMRLIQIKLSALGARLFRNTTGSVVAQSGHYVQYGLASPGGSDLIGWTSVKITPDMVGRTLAIFTAIEVKSVHGRLTKHQSQFIEAVHHAGGIAACARSIEEAERVVGVVSATGRTSG